MRTAASLAAVFMFACSGAGDGSFEEPTSTPENTPETAHTTPLAAAQASDSLPRGTAWLVWGSDHADGAAGEVDDDLDVPLVGDVRDPNLDLRTFALDAEGRVLAKFDAALIAANGTVFRWETEQVDVLRSPCAQIDDVSGLPNDTDEDRAIAARLLADSAAEKAELAQHPTTKVSRGSFVEETTRARTVISEVRELDGVRDIDFRALPLASFGSFVVVHEAEWAYACGAHGNWGSAAHVVDLTTMKSTDADALSFVDDAQVAGARAKAERAFAEDRAEWNGEPDKEPAALVELFPRYDTAGDVRLLARFVTFAPYAFSHGWASYSIGALAPIEPMPAAVAAKANAPAVVRDFVRGQATFTMRGFSRARE